MAVNFEFAETIDLPEPKGITEREMRKQRTDRGYKETRLLPTHSM